MCAGKMEDWKLMTENCVKALEIDDKNLKALFRRATASEKTKKYDEVSDMSDIVALALQRLSDRLVAVAQALADLKMAGEIAPEDKNVIKASNRVKKLKKKQEEREKKMCACPAFPPVSCSRLFQDACVANRYSKMF